MKNRKGARAQTDNSTAIVEVEDDKRKGGSHFPTFILSLSIIQIIFYVTFLTTSISDSLLVFNYKRRYQVWRYFTLALVHDGELHLFANISAQLLYGIQLEKRHGWKKVALLFLGGTCFGELLAASIYTSGGGEGVGASSGICALMVGYLASTNGQGKKCLHVLTIANVLLEPLPLLVCHYARNTEICIILKSTDVLETSSYFSHSGGSLVGILMGVPIFCKQNSTRYLVMKRICLLVGVLLFFVCVCMNCANQRRNLEVVRTIVVKAKLF